MKYRYYFDRYRQNLCYDDEYIYSYDTIVGKITDDKIDKVYWNVGGRTTSPTTSKHLNYASQQLGKPISLYSIANPIKLDI